MAYPIPRSSSAMLNTPARVGSDPRLLFALMLLMMGCQIALLFGAVSGLRVLFRSVGFGSSLVLLVCLPGSSPHHPARRWAFLVILLVVLGVAHPTSNSIFSGGAQVLMYAAILAPLFWAGRMAITPVIFQRLLLLMWGFQTLSAAVGVLQVYYPGQFQPAMSNTLAAQEWYLSDLMITLRDGQRVYRPMGLTDVPGGAASAGLFAALFGVGFLLNSRSSLIRVAAPLTIGVGLFCIYLSQVRVALVMFVVCALTLTGLILWHGDIKRVLKLFLIVPTVFIASLAWATMVGGETVTDRVATLVEDDPTRVYYTNRGQFLEWTLTEELPRFPLGAGAGRWGMMYAYFGDKDNSRSPPLWAEIQWTGWLYDGGVLLMLAYPAGLLATCWVVWKIATKRKTSLGPWAALLFAYNVSALACTFSYPFFISQSGMEFWLLNACLSCAACSENPDRRVKRETVSVAQREEPCPVGPPKGMA